MALSVVHKSELPCDSSYAERETVLELDHVCVCYGRGICALNQVDCKLQSGEHLVITGPSGSGKTTMLACMAGSINPQSGSRFSNKRIACIHQDLRLVSSLSALANVLHGSFGRHSLLRTALRFPSAEKRKALKLLKLVGLGDRIYSRVCKLSGGEKQRVAIARALMQDPEIILADEPIASLDDENANSILSLLKNLVRTRGITLVSVLHDLALARKYADRIIALDKGQLVSERVVMQLVSKPAADSLEQESLKQESSEQERLEVAANIDSRPFQEKKHHRLPQVALLGLLGTALIFWCLKGLKLSGRELENLLPGLFAFLFELFPDSWSEIQAIPWASLFSALLETLQMALLGSCLGAILAWPLAALAAKNIGPSFVRPLVRSFLNGIRTVPSLIWALLFVAAVGLGSLAGIMALTAYSIGYLSKFYYEAFEAVDSGPPVALREIGASGLQSFFHAVWPAAKPAVLSSSLFMLEYNVRAASVLGVVDAGGIGFYIKQYIDFRFFPAVTASLLLLFLVVVVLDLISCRIRTWLMSNS